MNEPDYRLVVASSAERALSRLPARVAAAVVEFMLGPLVESPRSVGHPLQRELRDWCPLGEAPTRVVYEIDEEQRDVRVLRIDHRTDVYRLR